MKNLLSLLLVFMILFFSSAKLLDGYTSSDKKAIKSDDTYTSDQKGSASFTFVGVGDNLIHQALWGRQEEAGQEFNFDSYYELTNKYTQAADLAFINSETLCAGEEFGLSHYPVFNGPTQILDAVNKAGFDWLALSSNHTLDMGPEGVIYELNWLKEKYPHITVTGSHVSEEAANTCQIIDVNGIKVGVLGYTYGLNGYSLPEDKPWLIDLIDEDKIKADLEKLSKESDVQIVSMHWGTEYNTGVDDAQYDLAKKLNEWGAEVIIGTHPHVIETAEIIHGADQDTLCYYSLGNFLSAQDAAARMIGGMASFTLNYNFDEKKTTFTDVKFIPTITYLNPSFTEFRTTTIHEYTDDMNANQYVTSLGDPCSRAYVIEYVQEVVGNPEGIEVVLN
ncbi:MAG: CapA family protein [Holdemanella sp.]|nr:CapA family protein [Holdemanella sp.]